MKQIIKNQFNYQLITVGSARTDQDYERRVKKRRHDQFYTGSSFLATSNLLCPSSKESSTKSISCSLTINL